MSGTSACGSASCGTFRSSTMMVMMTAMTPSLNASSLALFMTRLRSLSNESLDLAGLDPGDDRSDDALLAPPVGVVVGGAAGIARGSSATHRHQILAGVDLHEPVG